MLKTPKQQVALIGVSTLLAVFSLLSIVNFSDPQTATPATLAFFYLSLFLVSLGTLTVSGLFLRQWLKQGVYVVNLGNSFRQALLVSVLAVITFWLLGNSLFSWWLESSLVLCFIFLETFLNLKV